MLKAEAEASADPRTRAAKPAVPRVPAARVEKATPMEARAAPMTTAAGAKAAIMGSDAVEGFGSPLKAGNNFHISVVAKDKAEADRTFAALSSGGSVTMPLANAPWGPYFGMCVDKFGVQWMVSLPNPV
jgi:uncharacterized glyoxalase superfamily protein PhnB